MLINIILFGSIYIQCLTDTIILLIESFWIDNRELLKYILYMINNYGFGHPQRGFQCAPRYLDGVQQVHNV